jgi:hypothetical protein
MVAEAQRDVGRPGSESDSAACGGEHGFAGCGRHASRAVPRLRSARDGCDA